MKSVFSKRLLTAAVTVSLLFTVACREDKYDENDFIGRSSADIIAEYGNFDCIKGAVSDDGIYRNTGCGYTVKEAETGFLGTSEEELFFIHFNEDGIAEECYYGTRPGG